MANPEQGLNRDGNENPSSNTRSESRTSRIPGVDFQDMNFEQRRAPYNSGSRNIPPREYDNHQTNDSTRHEADYC